MPPNTSKDLIIVGGGIGGVICLHYARKAGLDALLLEKESVIGGLWAKLPAWQDIQQNRVDFTLAGLPIDGEDQASIVKNIRAWVEKFDLAPSILLNAPVTNAKSTPSGWQVTTPQSQYLAKNLIVATGSHNRPVIPDPVRAGSTIREHHSSTLREPGELAGQRVLVVGGGASAFDLLDLCFEHGAAQVHWLYRSVRWMVPTKKTKLLAGDVRWLGKLQMAGASIEAINSMLNDDLRSRYENFGLNAIRPADDFHLDRHQLIPGRCRMIQNFTSIVRHRGEVARLAGQTAALSSGEQIDIDTVLWGTGYSLDQSFFDEPNLATMTSASAVAARCGSKFISLDAPSLFFLAPSVLDGTGALQWLYAHAAIAIIDHIQGKARLSLAHVSAQLNYFDLIRFFATQSPTRYTPDIWPSAYEALANSYPASEPFPMPSFAPVES